MDSRLIFVIICAVIAIGAIFYMRANRASDSSMGLNFGQALGAGIIGLGLLGLVMPWAAGQIAVLDFINSSDFAILTGATYIVGILVVLAGAALLFNRASES